MARTKAAKDRKNNVNNKKIKLVESQTQTPKQKQKKAIKSKRRNPIQDEDPILFGSTTNSGSESESESPPTSPTHIHSLLEPYTKPQLIAFLLDAAPSDPDLLARIRSLADSDISHRKIFVHGLSWDATKENLIEVFSAFGPIEECTVIVDKNTGRAKGYGFVLFKARAGAVKALKEPQKRIGSRMASCQLATVGGVKPEGGRKIYVSNVPADMRPEKLREFFAKFGEIESGPMGFDAVTGKSRGYAIFVYKSQEEAKKALEEPYKMFGGHELHCKMATLFTTETPKPPGLPVQAVAPVVAPVAPVQAQQQSMLAAIAAAQNLALLGQNPAYAALLAQNPLLVQNPLLAAAALNPGLVNTAALGGGTGVQYGGEVPYGGGTPSMLGTYSNGQGTSAGLQGFQGYQVGSSSQSAHTSSTKAGGALGGFTSSYV